MKMRWWFLLPLLVFFVFSSSASAATKCVAPPGDTRNTYSTAGKIITYYVPHNAQKCKTSMEGCITTSCPAHHGESTPVCLDAVRLGKAQFVTVASAEENYGKYYYLGDITYKSAFDQQIHTVKNVIGYVHDTGCAFNGTCSDAMKARYGFSDYPRPDKLDICTTICPTCDDASAAAYITGKTSRIPSSQGTYDDVAVVLGRQQGGGGNIYTSFMRLLGLGNSQAPSQDASPNTHPVNENNPGSSTGGTVSVPAVATLVTQSQKIRRNTPIVVSWSSLQTKSCRVTITLPGAGEEHIAENTEGSKQIRVPVTASVGTGTLRLLCVPHIGSQIEKTVSVSIE